jgi:ring-1,2-phenylacetyl-CoA epoxidase subunit PaaE
MSAYTLLKVADVRRETSDAVLIRLEPPAEAAAKFAFKQGQYIGVRATIDGEEARRTYSLTSALGETDLTIAVKAVPGGRFSQFANTQLKAGDTLEATAPMGRFFSALEPEKAKTYAFFAAGSGVTPILSNVRTILAAEPKARLALFYGNRRAAGAMFAETLAQLKNRYMGRFQLFHCLTGDATGLPLLDGRITPERAQALLTAAFGDAAIHEAFLCGPGDMAQALKPLLEARGVPAKQIHIESFGAQRSTESKRLQPTSSLAMPAATQVIAILEDQQLAFPIADASQTVLEAGLAAGVALPYSCKAGVCCTCKVKLLEGQVDMGLSDALETYERDMGYILTCQAHALTPKLLIEVAH